MARVYVWLTDAANILFLFTGTPPRLSFQFSPCRPSRCLIRVWSSITVAQVCLLNWCCGCPLLLPSFLFSVIFAFSAFSLLCSHFVFPFFFLFKSHYSMLSYFPSSILAFCPYSFYSFLIQILLLVLCPLFTLNSIFPLFLVCFWLHAAVIYLFLHPTLPSSLLQTPGSNVFFLLRFHNIKFIFPLFLV